jgi:hypothetical protein
MTIAMDELDVAFLASTGAPNWQPLGSDDMTHHSAPSPASVTADDGWTEIARQIELDRIWAELAAHFA